MPNNKPPLTGMVQFDLTLRTQFPQGQMAELYPQKQWVELEIEFQDEEAAKRFESKVRKLLQANTMEVVDTNEAIDDGPGLPPT